MTMTRTKWILAVAVLLAASSLATAQEQPKWGYIQAGYIDFDPDGGVSDDGTFVGGGMQIFKMFHLMAEYDDIGDYTFWNAGFGWHGLLGDPADLYAEALWNDVEYDSASGDYSDDGYEVAAGVRWKILKWLEVDGKVSWVDFSDGGDDTAFEAGVLFTFLSDRLGVGASWETADADTLRAYARFQFGR